MVEPFCMYFNLVLICMLVWQCEGGEEVLAGFHPSVDDLKAADIALIQFDTRPLANYWNASAHWNKLYSLYHGHKYMYMSMRKKPCMCGGYKVAPAWCKVRAMTIAHKLMPRAKAFLYIDSDAVVTSNYSLADIVGFMRKDLSWDVHERPVAFNQDGPGWSCRFTMELGYDYCLNSGTVFWLNVPRARAIIDEWWDSCTDSYETSKFPSRWRNRWPWEQAQMYKVYDAHRDEMQRLSFPNNSFLPWTSKSKPKSQYPTDAVDPWCFSHWPGANCFITHHCASANQKKRMMEMYQVHQPIKLPTIYID